MSATILDILYELIEKESSTDKLTAIRRSIYRDVASHMKMLRNSAHHEEKNVLSSLSMREKDLLSRMTKRLLDIRLRKASSLNENDMDHLIPEEKYAVEPLLVSGKRLKRVTRSILNGQVSSLEAIAKEASSRSLMVRFLQPTPSMMGVDLQTYGPFEKEDVAILPMENARPLMKAGIVSEIWADEA